MIKRGGATALKAKFQGEMVSYCPKCLELGHRKVLMGARTYVDEEGNVIPPKADAHMWRQCPKCGNILPIYNLKREGRLVSQLTPSTDPFREKGDPKAISPKQRLGRNKRSKKNEFDFIQDKDIRQELKEGSQLISYSEN